MHKLHPRPSEEPDKRGRSTTRSANSREPRQMGRTAKPTRADRQQQRVVGGDRLGPLRTRTRRHRQSRHRQNVAAVLARRPTQPMVRQEQHAHR